MTDLRIATAAALAATLLGACATNRPAANATGGDQGETTITELMGHRDARLETYRIDDWSAPADDSLIVKSLDGSQYRATFMGHCYGLRFAESIGFVTRGTSSLDHFSGIVLPDGTRCTFKSFERSAPAGSAAKHYRKDESAGKR